MKNSSLFFGCLALVVMSSSATAANLVLNPGFETNSGNGTDPDAWTSDFNTYGAFDGGARTDAYGLHPGASSGTGGSYQDLATTPGNTYQGSLWVQNFAGGSGASNVRILAGAPGSSSPVAIDDQGSNTSVFNSAGLIHNSLYSTSIAGS